MREIICESLLSIFLVTVTVGYYHIVVFKTYSSNTANSLNTALNKEQVKFSPIKNESSLINILSYTCMYYVLS